MIFAYLYAIFSFSIDENSGQREEASFGFSYPLGSCFSPTTTMTPMVQVAHDKFDFKKTVI